MYIMNVDGSAQWKLPKPAGYPSSGSHPVIRPDGRKLAFSNGHIFLMDVDGSEVRPLITRSSYWHTFSLDGGNIAFTAVGDSPHNWEVWVMNADGSNPRSLTNHARFDGEPSFSPSGRRIAFPS